ncbi:MAG: hypothetical protein IKQ71_00675 [Lachnospiraceae bacterium]|nr:hypothetical protein [Lachnospiraceae bacterium]
MKKQRIGIIDYNEIFAKRLAGYMNKDQNLPFEVIVFTRADALNKYKDSLVFLLSGIDEAVSSFQGTLIKLVDTKTTDYDKLYRYQKASLLKADILERFEYRMPKKATEQSVIYGVYSPIGRCGKTTLALELLRQLSGSFYIGMETFNSLLIECQSIEPLLYGIMQKDENVFSEILDISGSMNGQRVLRSPDCFIDFKAVDLEHLSWFLAGLCERLMLSAVILDIGAGVFESPEMLKVCDRLIVPVDIYDDPRIRSMESGFKRAGFSDIIENMEYVRLPIGAEELKTVVKKLVEQ